MTEKEIYSLFVCGYRINKEHVDIFSWIIFDYLEQDNDFALTGIVCIPSDPIFCGSNLRPLMLCVLSYFLFSTCLSIIFYKYKTIASDIQTRDSNLSILIISLTKQFQYHQQICEPNFPILCFSQLLGYRISLQYDNKGEECDFLGFKILQELHCNERYIITKCFINLSHTIYFLLVTKPDSHILNQWNKVIDCFIGDLEQVSDIRIDTSEKVSLCRQRL